MWSSQAQVKGNRMARLCQVYRHVISDLDRLFAELETEELSPATQPKPTSTATTSLAINNSPRDWFTCWHCGGNGRCDCITCGTFEPTSSGTQGGVFRVRRLISVQTSKARISRCPQPTIRLHLLYHIPQQHREIASDEGNLEISAAILSMIVFA
jgi:hypothetical protein